MWGVQTCQRLLASASLAAGWLPFTRVELGLLLLGGMVIAVACFALERETA